MKVAVALHSVSRLFLDTAPVIYLVEQNPAYRDVVTALFQALDDGRLAAVTSPVTLAECLVHTRQALFLAVENGDIIKPRA